MTHDEIVALLAKMNVDIKQDDEELRVMEEESKKRDARRPYMLAEINRLIALGEEFREMQQQADISQKEKR
ncbi:MAG: hypothetical protein NT091_03365 [Candidatus Falkowbacteria bacterium]|nr:hypothetical protein [Candidatus Falkowbacteria bacterium]